MLTLQFIPYSEIEPLDTEKRIHKLLSIVKENKIVLMQGRLEVEEENVLIERTMEEINNTGFKGVEICTIYPESKNARFFEKIKKEIAKVLLGNREGLTIIGPATIIKEIKKDPGKIQLLTKDLNNKRRN